jgi:hypothetical protein
MFLEFRRLSIPASHFCATTLDPSLVRGASHYLSFHDLVNGIQKVTRFFQEESSTISRTRLCDVLTKILWLLP